MTKKEPFLFEDAVKEANRYVEKKRGLSRLVSAAALKAERNRKFLLAPWDNLQTLMRMIRAWLKGEYPLPTTTLVMAIAAVLYFVAPMDLIPDAIPVLGYMDDAAVIAYVVGVQAAEIRRFLDWEYSKTAPPPE